MRGRGGGGSRKVLILATPTSPWKKLGLAPVMGLVNVLYLHRNKRAELVRAYRLRNGESRLLD